MGGVWKEMQYPKRGFQKVFHSREGFGNFLCPSTPEKSSLDQISSYCTSVQILIRSLQYANMITFRSHADSNLIL